jgi:hypothetical protein
MIVSEQSQPTRPPILALPPVLESEPRSRMFTASVYLGGRCESSAIAIRPMLSSLALTSK